MKMSDVFKLPLAAHQNIKSNTFKVIDSKNWELMPTKEQAEAAVEAVNTHDQKELDIHRLLEGLKDNQDEAAHARGELLKQEVYDAIVMTALQGIEESSHQLRTELIKTYGAK